jgi:CTP:molybdopterin cytidylyltransferase MocA
MSVTVAVVLAAGAGRRFLGPAHKLDTIVGGRPLVVAAVDAALTAAIGPVVVVTAGHLTATLPSEIVEVVNDEWERGQMSSLHRGIAAAESLGGDRVVVGLGDQPAIEPSAWRAVAEAGSVSPIAVATYGGRRGHPVSLAESVWPLLAHGGDEGARTLLRLRPDLVSEVPCQGSALDIDTLEDLDRWQNSSSTSSR